MCAGQICRSIATNDLLGRNLSDIEAKNAPDMLYLAGPMEIPLPRPRVSIVGSRDATDAGRREAAQISRMLVNNNVVIVSGLADGIDATAHSTAMAMKGSTIAVIGTPLEKSYPARNRELQQRIMREHLVVSQFPAGSAVARRNFVIRNYTMALISDAAVIVQAGNKSGSLYHGREMLRLGRPLFIYESAMQDDELTWPEELLKHGAMILSEPEHLLEMISPARRLQDTFR